MKLTNQAGDIAPLTFTKIIFSQPQCVCVAADDLNNSEESESHLISDSDLPILKGRENKGKKKTILSSLKNLDSNFSDDKLDAMIKSERCLVSILRD